MQHSFARRALRVVKWFVIGLLLLIICGAGFIYFAPEGWLRHLVADRGSQQLGRSFAVDGDIHIDWDWTTPFVHVGKLRLANPQGSPDPDMINIEELNFHIKIWKLLEGQMNLPDIDLVNPHILLEKKADGTKNWDLPVFSKANAVSTAVLPSKRSNFPLIGLLTVHDGSITYRDATVGLDLTLGIDSATGNDKEENGNFKLSGKGTLQEQPFVINAQGGSLSMLRDSSADYPLDLTIEMGKTKVAVKGTFTDPVKMEDVNATLDLRGDTLANLFYLTALPLPPTPPYQLSGQLTKHGDIWAFKDFQGKVGQSDLSGNLTYDTSGERGLAKAMLVSHLLNVDDLSGFLGKKSATANNEQKLLPDMPIDLKRLRTTDLDIDLKADKIDEPGWPLENLEAHFLLKDGLLKIDPFSFGIADGQISGPVVLDGRKDEPVVNADLQLHRLSLKPFFTDSKFADFSAGHFGGRLTLDGHGDSLAQVLSDSNGRITFLMGGGGISKLIVDAAGLDFGKATPALLGKDKSTPIRCAIGDFGVQDGILHSDIFVIDTGASNIQGNADINLKDETIDAKIEAHPKEASLTARTPITLTGKLRKPSIGLDPKEIAARGTAAAALSAVLTPLAAIIPFIDPGLGEDSDCHALIDEAQAHSGVNAPTSDAPAPQQP